MTILICVRHNVYMVQKVRQCVQNVYHIETYPCICAVTLPTYKHRTSTLSQAQFKSRSAAIMAAFFSLTTPIGIAVGTAISRVYSETSPTALIVQGTLESAAAGILIYMALVDLLAADFMCPRMQGNRRIQLGSYISLLLGTGCMSFLAKWA